MKQLVTDLAVMGSGLAGLTAAVTAAEKGIKVAVFEKRPFQGGGVSNTPMMTMAVRDSQEYKDKAFMIHMDYTNWNANPAMVRAWINNSCRIPEFIRGLGLEFLHEMPVPLEEMGVKRGYAGGFPNGFNIGDLYFFKPRGKGHGAALICKKMADRLKELGGELHVSTEITGLVRADGKVTGAIATDKQGNEIKISAKATIVASGGFSDNPEFIKKYTGHTYTNNNCDNGGDVLFNTFPNAKMTGDGQAAVWAIGGAQGSMGINGHNLVPGPGIIGNTPWIVYNEIRTIQEQPYLWVNQLGQRFISEEMSNDHMAMGTAITNQKDKCSYIVFDEATVHHMEQEGLEYIYHIFPAEKLTKVREQFEELINVKKNNHIFLADSIEELCQKTGIDYENMSKTVDDYNKYCDQGLDEEFAKNPAFLRPVRQKKFYAMRVFKGGYQALGGIKINGKCEVLDQEFRVIKGLYSAGDCAAGEIYGNPPTGGIGVSTISFAQGFVSADEVASYINKGKEV